MKHSFFGAACDMWVKYRREECGKEDDVSTLIKLWEDRQEEFVNAYRYSIKMGYSRLTLDPKDQVKTLKKENKALRAELNAVLKELAFHIHQRQAA